MCGKTWEEAIKSTGEVSNSLSAMTDSLGNLTFSTNAGDFTITGDFTTASDLTTTTASSITIGTSDPSSYSPWGTSGWTTYTAPVSPADVESAKQEARERCEIMRDIMRREFGKDLLVVLEACRMLLIDGAPLEEKVSTIEELQNKLMEAYGIVRKED